MRKFLETFDPFVSLYNLKRVFPEYATLFDQIEDLDDEVKKGTTKQVEIEYYDLMETLDGFLLKTETIEKYNQAFPNSPLDIDLLEDEDVFDEQESRAILEDEIKLAMDELDDKVIQAQIQSDQTQVKKRLVERPKERITKDMLDVDQQYVGISIVFDEITKVEFNRAVAILKVGVNFSNLEYAGKKFVKFELGNETKLIIETPELVTNFVEIFDKSSKERLCYLLCKNEKELQSMFNIVGTFIYFKDEDVTKLDDDFLYNNPVIYGAYNDFLYEKVELFSQKDKGLRERANYIKTYFNLYLPLEQIITLTYCKQIHSRDYNFSVEQNKNKILEDVSNKTFKLEGVGVIPVNPDVLDVLEQKSLIDNLYKPTPLAEGILSYNFVGEKSQLQNDFRPFTYYIANLKEDLEKAQEVYYSTYNGTSVYHTKTSLIEIDYALALTTEQLKGYSFNKKVEGNSFAKEWQANQDFNNYVEYKPFCAGGSLQIKERASSGPDVINLQDYKKFDLWFANMQRPYINWALNSSHYNFIKEMYSDRNIKVMGPESTTPTTQANALFFNVVDDNNNLLAILRPLGTRNKTQNVEVESSGKIGKQLGLELSTSWKLFSSSEIPNPVWDFDEIIDTLKEENGDFMTKGVYLDEASESGQFENRTVRVDDTGNLIGVGYDDEVNISKLDDAVKENVNSEELQAKYDELEALEEAKMEIGEDEDIDKEIEKVKKEIQELKEKEVEEKEVEEKVDDFDKEKILDEINDDFRYSFPSSLKAEQVSVERDGDEVRLDTRYLGDWFVPDDAEDEQDYDWEELDRDDYKRFRDKFNEWVSSKDWAKYVDTSLQTHEKNWISFSVILKK